MKNIDWDKVIKKSWYWTKVFFVCFGIIYRCVWLWYI